MIGMSRFQSSVALAPVPRPLMDEVVRALLDALEELPFTDDGHLEIGAEIGDVRLVEGKHLTAGARYRIVPPDMESDEADIEVKVVSWKRAGESRIELTSDVDGHVLHARLELRMVGQRAHTLRAAGSYQGPGPGPLRKLQRANWEAEVRFEEWWSVLGQRTSPISLRVKHPLAIASFLIDRGKDKDERWAVEGRLRSRGRWIARPVAAIALLAVRSRVRRALSDGFGKAEAAWNGFMPDLVERGLQERVTLRHQVEVKPVSREWAEEYVTALHQAVEGLRFEKGRLTDTSADVRLIEGEHIEAGSRYRFFHEAENEDEREPESLDVSVAAWDLAGPSRVEFSGTGQGPTGWAEIDSAQKPAVVRGAVTMSIEEFTQLGLEGEANLERWWADVGGSGGDVPALTATIDHRLGEGSISIAGSPAEGDRWKVDVTVAVEGRDWARPLIAVAALVGFAAIDDSFKDLVNETAENWDGAIPGAVESEPRRAAEATLRRAMDGAADDGAADDGAADDGARDDVRPD
ncbi:hypothetical protein [Actinomadura sp. 7K507]|uniref:hypothetical protein n=1 Tax=Actinomadura sp. 7K507 TaxID=2530365 RepID=UPI001049FA8C|nr:hypothetical protein [Actinomadura sp. 7K507]TDC98468.1 hypothetical protein E1285_00660 [Actinomadura sp. 7K507]